MALDLIVLAVIAGAALHGAFTGALRQLVQLAGVAAGWFAARHLGAAVAGGLSRWLGAALSRPVASALLFAGGFALVTLLGGALLRASGLSGVVRGPADRGTGALLGGAKGIFASWVLLSALALAGTPVPGGAAVGAEHSQLLVLAGKHNLLVQLDPKAAASLQRAVKAARDAQKAARGALGGPGPAMGAGPAPGAPGPARKPDPIHDPLLEDPRIRALVEGDGALDTAEVSRLLQDPKVRALLERLEGEQGLR